MPKIYDVVYPESEYTDTATGQQKTRWKNCGAVIKSESGRVALKLDGIPVNPRPNQDGQPGLWFQLMTPQPRQNPGQPPAPAPAAPPPVPAAPDDDIPF